MRGLVSSLINWVRGGAEYTDLGNVVRLCFFFLISWAATIPHEVAHWSFIVPFGGHIKDWHWYTPLKHMVNLTPSDIDIPSREPWNALNYYAGGIVGATFLCAFLFLWVLPRLRHNANPFWQYSGAILVFALSAQFAIGIIEGISQGQVGSLYVSYQGITYLIAICAAIGALWFYLYRLFRHIRVRSGLNLSS